ncbi:hypothetical protein Q3H58_004450 [Pseudomonas psychrotolerans]|nr:hypothetical protein [Pseudomonas psychrotolerans]
MQAWIDATQRVTQAVHAAEPLLEGQRALQRGAEHLGPRLDIARLVESQFQIAPGTPQAIQGDAFGRRIEAGSQEGLDAMRHRVHARGRGQVGRQAERQGRIADRHARYHIGREDAHLAAIVENDDGATTDLAAGAGGGGNGHDGHRGRGDPGQASLDEREILQRSRMAGGHRDGLGQVDGRASADGDDAVAVGRMEAGHALAGCSLGGVGRSGVEHLVSRQRIQLQQLPDEAGRYHSTVGDD